MFCFNLGEAAVDEFFYSRFTFNLSFCFSFSTWKWLVSNKGIILLSAALPLAIGLICFWFVIALLLYRESVILGLSFLDPKDLCLPNSFHVKDFSDDFSNDFSDVKEETG